MADTPHPSADRPVGSRSRVVAAAVLALVVAGAVLWKHALPAAGEAVWLAALILQILIRAPYAARNAKITVVASRADIGERILLALMFAGMVALPLLSIGTPLLSGFDYALPVEAVYAGAAMQLAFLYYFWRSHADLDTNWSPTLEVREGHGLVTDGIYRRMRHPMYLAIWIAVLSQPLLIQNWIAGPFVIAAFALMYFIRVPREEAMMRERFGVQWDDYAARTPRLSL